MAQLKLRPFKSHRLILGAASLRPAIPNALLPGPRKISMR